MGTRRRALDHLSRDMRPPLSPESHAPPAGPAAAAGDDLVDIHRAGTVLHEALERAVVRYVLEGASWADVGRALGISRQAARQRFRHLDLGVVQLRVRDGVAWFESVVLGERVGPGTAGRVGAARSLQGLA